MSEIPTGHVINPYDWREDERSQRDELIAALEAPDGQIDPLPGQVEVIELRADDAIASAWSGFVTSQLPDLTADYDRKSIAVGKPRKSRRRGPPPSPITPYNP